MDTLLKRILIIDDVQSIRSDMRKSLCPPISAEELMAQLIKRQTIQISNRYEIHEAGQGLEGVDMAMTAFKGGYPYDVIIVDMKMPPGIDGMETIRLIREFDREAYIIVCTAFSEYHACDLAEANGGIEPAMLYKPFESEKVLIDAVLNGERGNARPAE